MPAAGSPRASEWASRLAATDVPTLVVVGTRDRLSLATARQIARTLPRARLVEVEDAGHVVNLAAPEPVNAALREFLDGLGSE